MSDSKKEALFKKLDKRHEDHLAAKERNKEAREEQDESKTTLATLLDWSGCLNETIESEIEKKNIDKAQEILDGLSNDMQKLDTFFTENSPVLTKFDKKKVQDSVLEIRSRYSDLQDVLRPKKKFGFRGDKKKAFQNKQLKESGSKPALDVAKNQEFGFTIKERSNETIEINDNEANGQDVMLSQLSNCTVIVKSNPITLHATHLNGCILKCGPVQTSIYLDQCNDCNLSLACQQLRAHNSMRTKVFLHVTSKGIIEDCKEIQVAPYNFTYDGIEGQFDKLGLDINTNHWNQLDDFNWLASDQPSPNWSILHE